MKSKSFREWFTQDYLMKINISSPLLTGNKAISDRQERICKVAEKIISNPKKSLDEIRKEVAVELFITMRCALDYINYANLFITMYNKYRKV